jgi:hypothetical protein
MLVGEEYSDLIEMHKRMVLRIARSKRRSAILDDVRGSAAISLTNLVFAKSTDFESFDLGHAGFGDHRWRMFLRQYIDSEQFHSWIRQAAQVKRNGAELLWVAKPIHRIEKVKLNETSTHLYGANHRWGNCLLGMTFGFKPYPQIMMHSRTSALTKGGVLDLTLASIAARELGKVLGIEQRDISFAWASGSFQVSCWQLLTLAAAWGMTERICTWDTPTGVGFNRYVTRGRNYHYQSSLKQQEKADKIAAGTMPVTLVSSLGVPL